MTASRTTAEGPRLGLTVMQRRQAAASDGRPNHLTDQDRDGETYVPKVLDLLLFIPNATIGT
jgi:hypothetical protein